MAQDYQLPETHRLVKKLKAKGYTKVKVTRHMALSHRASKGFVAEYEEGEQWKRLGYDLKAAIKTVDEMPSIGRC